ncbi:MAG: DUF6272 family protein, partial [Pseudomonas sp.]
AVSCQMTVYTKLITPSIKQAYKVSLRAQTPVDSKGAGLGFLTMARDASAPLEFAFHPRADDPDTTLFCLKAII